VFSGGKNSVTLASSWRRRRVHHVGPRTSSVDVLFPDAFVDSDAFIYLLSYLLVDFFEEYTRSVFRQEIVTGEGNRLT